MAIDAEARAAMLGQVRRFVDERLIPNEERVSREDAIPGEIIAEMAGLGLFGTTIPEDYGGLGFSMEDETLLLFELGRASTAFRSAIGTNVGIGSQGLVMFGSEAQKQKYLPKIAAGEIITSFALTEPEAGSDAASLRTSARREGDHYVLNGAKRYITNADKADLFTVLARTNPNEKGGKGVSAFLVPRDTPGLSIGKSEKKMGQQGAHVCDVNFDDARVPAENLLGAEGQGFALAKRVLTRGRIHIASLCVGAAERLIEESLRYAGERKQFGQPIGEFQLVQAMLAESRTEAYAARTMVMDAARRRDGGEDVTMHAACAKLFASEMAGRVADRAVQIFGGAGYVAGVAERFYRDVRLFRIYEGTSEIQKLVIAREMKRGAKV
ncbi:MAG TPA: acyl-CoA dehydrogenase family protein [Caulobacterales bacterium]|nr:acyl-CoA dehydrogenase family protein [Caulobacterales bacterium]